MYVCDECDHVFEKPKSKSGDRVEYHGVMISLPLYYVCPHCESENFTETVRCNMCNRIVSEDKAVFGACPECAAETIDKLNIPLSDVEKEFLNNYVADLVGNNTDVF